MRWGLGIVVLVVDVQLARAQHPPLPPEPEPQPESVPEPRSEPPAPTDAAAEVPTIAPKPLDPVLQAPPPVESAPPLVDQQPTFEKYPRALVARPLVLPLGGVELAATMSAIAVRIPTSSERVFLSPNLRLTPVHAFDVDVSLTLLVHDSTPDIEFSPVGDAAFLNRFSLRALGQASATTALGVEFVHLAEGENLDLYAPHIVLVTRHRTSARSAFEVSASAGPDLIRLDDEIPINRVSSTNFGCKLQLRARAQVAATTAFEGRAAIGATTTGVRMPFPDAPVEMGTFSTFGLGAVISVTPAVDVVLGFDAVSAATDANELSITIVARRLP